MIELFKNISMIVVALEIFIVGLIGFVGFLSVGYDVIRKFSLSLKKRKEK